MRKISLISAAAVLLLAGTVGNPLSGTVGNPLSVASAAEMIELPAYNQVFDRTTTAAFEVPEGWELELKESALGRSVTYTIDAKIDGTPMYALVGLQLVPKGMSAQELSEQYTKNFLNVEGTEIADHRDLGGGLRRFLVRSGGRISSVNYHFFKEGAGSFVTLMIQNDHSAVNDDVDLGAKRDDIENFLRSVSFTEAGGAPVPAVKKLSTVRKAEPSAPETAAAAGGIDISSLKGSADIRKLDETAEVFEVAGGGITSLTAVGHDSLREIKLSGAGMLKSLKISECPALKRITIADCAALEDIDFGGGLVIEEITITGDMAGLTSLNVSSLSELKTLSVKGLKQLESLWAGETALTELDLTGCSALNVLNVEDGKIEKIIITGCDELSPLAIDGADDAEIVE